MSDTTESDDEVQRLGAYIKSKRLEMGFSLRDLAVATGLSATFLSNFERGVANPTLESLRKVANALKTPILYMTNGAQGANPVVRHGQRRHLNLSDGHIRYEILTPTLAKKMVLFEGRIVAEQGNIVAGPLPEPTEECLVMLSGRISICLSGQTYELEAGDSIYFEGGSLESIIAMGDGEARYISAITPPVF
ncbi:MAG TPA: XRE family transcriptional regulator [Anaerolineales bacterium]|nr:XRE family transcriptional regulator [Anaerolineales bacterium]